MKKLKIILFLAVLVTAALGGWRVAACEIANLELQEDLHDIAAKAGVRIGNYAVHSDDEFREDVIHKAQEYDIQLKPEQVTVQRQSSDVFSPVYLAADYSETVSLASYSVTLHFTPSSTKKAF